VSSHDIGELEMLADHVGILAEGRMRLSASMDDVHARFKRVEVTASEPWPIGRQESGWMSFERGGNRFGFVTEAANDGALQSELSERFPAAHVEVRAATLREVFVAVADSGATAEGRTMRISA